MEPNEQKPITVAELIERLKTLPPNAIAVGRDFGVEARSPTTNKLLGDVATPSPTTPIKHTTVERDYTRASLDEGLSLGWTDIGPEGVKVVTKAAQRNGGK